MHRLPILEDDLWADADSGAQGPSHLSESSESATPAHAPALARTSASPLKDDLASTRSPQPCTACQERIRTQDGVTRVPCGHSYHPECLLTLIEVSMRTPSQFPPHCCRQPISRMLVWALLDSEQWEIFERLQLEHSTPRPLYCPTRRCSRFLGSRSDRIPVQVYTCDSPGCSTRTCARCTARLSQREVTENHVCTHDPEQAAVLLLGTTQGWVRCPGCQQLVERNGGCPHMTCLCGTEFCYTCGQRFRACVCGQRRPPRPTAIPDLAHARPPAPRPTPLVTPRPRRDLPPPQESPVGLPIDIPGYTPQTHDERRRVVRRSAMRRPGAIPDSVSPIRQLRFALDEYDSIATVTQATPISSGGRCSESDFRTLTGDPREERPTADPVNSAPVTYPSTSRFVYRRRDASGSLIYCSPGSTPWRAPSSMDGHHSAPTQVIPISQGARPAPDSEDRMLVDDSDDERALPVQRDWPLSRMSAPRRRVLGEGLGGLPGEDIIDRMEVSPTSSIMSDAGDHTFVDDTERGRPQNGSARWRVVPFAASTSTAGPKYTFEWR